MLRHLEGVPDEAPGRMNCSIVATEDFIAHYIYDKMLGGGCAGGHGYRHVSTRKLSSLLNEENKEYLKDEWSTHLRYLYLSRYGSLKSTATQSRDS